MTHTSKSRIDGLRSIFLPGHDLRKHRLKAEVSVHPLAKTEIQRRLQKHILATLSGAGRLYSSTGEVGVMRYHLPVRQAHGTQVGDGVIWGDEDLLRGTYMDSEHTLQISDGRRIPILLTDLNSNSAEFRTTGPIPGFENSFVKAGKVYGRHREGSCTFTPADFP